MIGAILRPVARQRDRGCFAHGDIDGVGSAPPLVNAYRSTDTTGTCPNHPDAAGTEPGRRACERDLHVTETFTRPRRRVASWRPRGGCGVRPRRQGQAVHRRVHRAVGRGTGDSRSTSRCSASIWRARTPTRSIRHRRDSTESRSCTAESRARLLRPGPERRPGAPSPRTCSNRIRPMYTFTLKDAKYSNGDPIVADDLVYSVEAPDRSPDGGYLPVHHRRRRRRPGDPRSGPGDDPRATPTSRRPSTTLGSRRPIEDVRRHARPSDGLLPQPLRLWVTVPYQRSGSPRRRTTERRNYVSSGPFIWKPVDAQRSRF